MRQKLTAPARDLLLLLLTGLALAVLALPALEVGLRALTHPPFSLGYLITHPTRHFELNPGFRGYTYNVPFRVNSFGMRDEERPVLAGGDALRVAVLGDSLSFGQGVELEGIYPKLLERKLGELRGAPTQVLNFAVPGYNLVNEWDLLKEKYETFKPDLVLFQFSIQDDTILADAPESQGGLNRFRVVRKAKDILRNLYSYNFVAGRLFKLRAALSKHKGSIQKPKSHVEQIAEYFDDDYAGWLATRKAFGEIARFSRERRVPVVFVLFTDAETLRPGPETDSWQRLADKVTAALHKEGFENVLRADDAFRGYAGNESALHLRRNDYHLSPLAHGLVANAIYDLLVERKLVAAAPRRP